MKVLIVDDDLALASLFQTALVDGGYQVITAPDGKTGLEKTKSEKPNFILLDQVLPDMKGNEVLKTLKEDEETKGIPVALLSNFGQGELVQDAINHGALDYILKYQIEPKDLVEKVKELMNESSTQPATQ